jgi:hypothetical protein
MFLKCSFSISTVQSLDESSWFSDCNNDRTDFTLSTKIFKLEFSDCKLSTSDVKFELSDVNFVFKLSEADFRADSGGRLRRNGSVDFLE